MLATKAVPPVALAYHCSPTPVAVKFAIVAVPTKTCGLTAVGAVGALTVTDTATLFVALASVMRLMALLPKSATNILPLASAATPKGTLNPDLSVTIPDPSELILFILLVPNSATRIFPSA